MTRRFEGISVLVAGGTGALGRAVSLAFLDELAKVTVTYRRPEEFLALKNADPFQAFAVETVSGQMIAVNVPDDVEVTGDGTCARVKVRGVPRHIIALEWVIGIEIGGAVGARPR